MNQTTKQLSHRELIDLLVNDCQHRPAMQEFMRRYDEFIRCTVARTIYRNGAGRGTDASATAEDLVSEIYYRLFRCDCRALQRFQNRYHNSIFAYLRTICMNVVRNYHRDYVQKDALGQLQALRPADEGCGENLLEQVVDDSTANGERARAEETEMLSQAVGAASFQKVSAENLDRNLIIFKLHFLYGYHYHEIARIKGLGLGESGVGNTAARLRLRLRQELTHESWNH